MKYLNTKHSRRKGVAIELAIMLLLVMVAMGIMLVSTTMIQINKQKQSFDDLKEITQEIEKIEFDQVGKYFKQLLVQNINQTDEENIPSEEYLQEKLLDKYFDYFESKNLFFVIETSRNVTYEDFTEADKEDKSSEIKTYEDVTELYEEPDDINPTQNQEETEEDNSSEDVINKPIKYIVYEVTTIETITRKVTKVSGTKYQIYEDFTLKIYEETSTIGDNIEIYEITIRRRLHKTATTTQVYEYVQEQKTYEMTKYLFDEYDDDGNNIIDDKDCIVYPIKDISSEQKSEELTYLYVATESDYSISKIEHK